MNMFPNSMPVALLCWIHAHYYAVNTVDDLLYYYKWGFNRCPFQLLRSYKRHEENKRKIGQERSSMQQANVIGLLHECKKVCPWRQESVSMHKSPTPVRHSRMNQARAEEEEKERQERQRPGGWWKERQNKTHLRN